MADQDDLIISISTDTTTIKRALTKLVGDVDAASSQISRKFDNVGKSLDNSVTTALQARVNAIVGIGTQGAREWNGALADQGKQLDALRAKYNPLFATITQYKSAQGNIKTLLASGVISSDEYSAAMSRQRQATLASIAAIKGTGVASAEAAVGEVALHTAGKLSNSQFQALAHSVRSVTEQLALGISPTQALVGQMSHLSYVASGEGGVMGALKAIGSGALGLAASFPAVTLAIGAAAAAGGLYYAATHASSDRSEEDLQKQIDLIKGVAAQWGDATPALSAYIAELDRAKSIADLLEAGKAAGDLGFDTLRDDVKDANAEMGDLVTKITQSGNTDSLDALEAAWKRVQDAIKEGRDDTGAFKALHDALSAGFEQTGIPALQDFGTAVDEIAKKLAAAAKQAQIFNAEAIAAIAGGSNVQDIVSGNSFNDGTGKTFQTSTFTPENGPTPERRPNIELEGLPGDDAAAKKAATAAESLKKKQDELLTSTSDRIEKMQQEIDLSGQSAAATDAARFALEEWQKAEKLSLNDDQKAALQDKIDQYTKLAAVLAQTKLSADLADKDRLASMSDHDQKIVQMQRQFGLPEDVNSASGKQISSSLNKDDARDTAKSFATSFRDNIVKDGGNIGKAFGESIKQTFLDVLTKASDKAIDSLVNSLVNAIFGSGSGAASGASAVGGIASKIAGGVTGTAPVIPVTRSALPDVGSSSIAAYISKAASARGIDPATALAVAKSEGGLSSWNMQSGYMKNGVQEPSFGPFQLYKGGGLGNVFQKQTGMDPALASSGPAGVDFALDHAKQNGWGSWYGAKNTGISNWQGIGAGGGDAGLTDASKALEKLAGSTTDATKGLGQLSTGLGSLGTSFAGAGSGSAVGATNGLWGGIGKLFGGISPTSPLWAPNSTYGSFIGLADGGHVSGSGSPTSDSIPAMLSNGEFVVNAASTKKHRALIEAINTGKVAHLAGGGMVSPNVVAAPTGPALASRNTSTAQGGGPGVLQVHINGANGDDHIRTLVKQGVGEGLNQYNDSQVRGGFGTNQNRWQARKG